MYKTWDNELSRKTCLKAMKDIEKFFIQKRNFNLQLGKLEKTSKILLKTFIEYKKLKELCDYGCIHSDLHDPIHKLLSSYY